jgi:hypothetical protein
MATTTHISQRKEQSVSLMNQVLNLLNWTVQDYADFKYQRGIAYLRWYLPANDRAIRQLMRNRLFWNWWKNCWDTRDEVFITECTTHSLVSRNALVQLYKMLHDSRELATEIKPAKSVLIDALNVKQELTLKEVTV